MGLTTRMVVGLAVVLVIARPAVAQDPHAGHLDEAVAAAVGAIEISASMPPDEANAKDALAKSPRHGEYVDVIVDGQAVKTWVVYPERKDTAPVVIVIHEIFGLSDWIRAVADQLAYGVSPDATALATTKAPILGLYGADDARVDATIEPAAAEMKRLGKPYEYHILDGAGHGFLRQQTGRDGSNMKAAEQAWPMTLAFIRDHTK